MGCAPVRRDNPRALARGLSTVQAHNVPDIIQSGANDSCLSIYGSDIPK